MTPSRLHTVSSALILATTILAFSSSTAFAQRQPAPSRLVAPIDERVLATLPGNVRQDVAYAPDLGPVEDEKPMRLTLLLQPTAAQQADLENLIARQQEPGAKEYHQWLTPAEYGARFGASPDDIAKLTAWLGAHGFEVKSVLNNASMIDFAATAGQVREAFHTQLHYVNVEGGKYPALVQDPQIPAALAPVVAGIHGLNQIPHRPNHTVPRQVTRDEATHSWQIVNPTAADMASPAYDAGSGDYFVAPQDLYTIYDINPVFTAGNLAATATVAVIEESDIEYGTVNSTTHVATGGDVATFRSVFGVPGTLNMLVYHGFGTVTCNDPGIDPDGTGEDFEASLDAEWANATAPSATLIFMSCDQSPDDGISSSMEALIDNNLADVMSLSYGGSEDETTASDYTFQDGLYTQAATQGQTIVISTGDSGSDVRDQDTTGTATHGINVSSLSASPLVTAAGGTDFQDLYDSLEGGSAQSTYWSSTNTTFFGDALKYVPETAWNDSCASSIITKLEGDTGAGFCATDNADFTSGDVVGGSGGISTHYSVPAWQTGISGYSNSMRSQPDIAGFAANGVWGHALIACDSHQSDPCTSSSNFGLAGGTSFVAPYMAGVFGLLRTGTGSRQGVVNPALYALAKAQYTNPATSTACYANGQATNTGLTSGLPAASCIFNDVTTSNNDVPCKSGSTSCFVNSGKTYGMLSLTGSSSLTVAYASAAGYDQVTGIGSINVANLIADWNTAFTSSTSLSANPTSLSPSQSTELTATVTGGTPTGYVDTPPALTGSITFKAGTTVVGSCTLSSGTCSSSVAASSLQSGANSLTAIFGGSGTYPSSTSSSQTVTVNAATTTTTAANETATFSTSNQNVTLSATVTSGSGTVNEGTVTFTVLNGSTPVGTATTSGTVSGGNASVSYTLPAGTTAGTYTIQAVYNGDQNFNGSTDTSHTLTVNAAATTTAASNATASYSVSSQGVSLTAAVTSGAGAVNGGTVTFTVLSGGTPVGTPVTSGTVTNGSASANFTLPAGTAAGTYTIQAVYNGGQNFNGSTDTSHTLVVNAATTAAAASNAAANYSASSQVVSLSAAVTSGAGAVNGGTITFTVFSGGTQIGTAVTSGTVTNGSASANFTLPAGTSAGTYSIHAAYNGSTNFTGSSDNSHALTVSPAGSTTAASNQTASFSASSQSVALSATVTSSAGTVSSGTVTFTVFSGSTQIGTAVTSGTVTSGSASANYALPGGTAAGTYTIDAVYSGSTNFNSSTDTSHTLTVTSTTQTITFSPKAGTYTTAQQVTILDSVAGATIYYTTNGTTPTTGSAVFSSSSPISVSENTTIKALGVASGYKNTSVTMAVYKLEVATPTFSPKAGTYTTPQSVSISDTATGAAIWYTTDGTTPAPNAGTSIEYSGTPIAVNQNTTIKAIAVVTDWTNSMVATAAYGIKLATPTFSPKMGTYTTPQSVSISDTATGAAIWYTTDGTTPVPGSGTAVEFTGTPIAVNETTIIKAIATQTGFTNSMVASGTVTLKAPTPTFSPKAGTYTTGQSVSILDSNSSAVIWYTTDGTTPTAGGGGTTQQYTGPISVSSTETVKAVAAVTGWTASSVATGTFTIN